MAIFKDKEEITALRASGKIAAQTLRHVAGFVRPGISTFELNEIAEKYIRAHNARPTFLGFQGYTASLCTSVNDQVVHGIPSREIILKKGDIIGLDIGVEFEDAFSDHAITVPVGPVAKKIDQLLIETAASLRKGIAAATLGNRVGDIGHAVSAHLEPLSYGVVRQLCGHGVGKAVHEPPEVPNYGRAHSGPLLTEGLVIAIEPMVTMGGWEVDTLDDGWTIVTADGSPAAHFEHTILITAKGPEIITVI